ncbi:MAG TPA: hypothetical protein VJ772_08035 [Nitrososphaeraceae archaeon]|jgi:hypothetical protein|nr:hypothetical protein [Nitrososphaeraceae archaeon]
MKLTWSFSSIILSSIIILLSENEEAVVYGVIVENNPFYGLSNEKINIVESITEDKLMKIKLEYAPKVIEVGSPEFFKVTLYHVDKDEIALHADTDIVVSKNGKELYKASDEFSQPFVHTPNGIVLSSYKFPDSGQYMITVKVLGINFIPVSTMQASFTTNVTDSNNKYLVEIVK